MPKETYQLPKSLNCSNNRGEQVLFVLRKQFSLRCSYSLPSVTAEYCIDANTPQKAAATTPIIHMEENNQIILMIVLKIIKNLIKNY